MSGAGPAWSYNHVTNDLTFPVGTGVFKTLRIGNTPLKLGAEVWYYTAKPDAFGNNWQLRFKIQPVLPVLW